MNAQMDSYRLDPVLYVRLCNSRALREQRGLIVHRVGSDMGHHRPCHHTNRKTLRQQHHPLTTGTNESMVQARCDQRAWTSPTKVGGVFS